MSRDGEAIPPDPERTFAQCVGAHTIEVASGHLAMVSHSGEFVRPIELAVGQGAWQCR